jgi:hypothetical protein
MKHGETLTETTRDAEINAVLRTAFTRLDTILRHLELWQGQREQDPQLLAGMQPEIDLQDEFRNIMVRSQKLYEKETELQGRIT